MKPFYHHLIEKNHVIDISFENVNFFYCITFNMFFKWTCSGGLLEISVIIYDYHFTVSQMARKQDFKQYLIICPDV